MSQSASGPFSRDKMHGPDNTLSISYNKLFLTTQHDYYEWYDHDEKAAKYTGMPVMIIKQGEMIMMN